MSKAIAASFEPSDHEKVEALVNESNLSYILITCTSPSQAGQMNVEMSWKGDEDVIGYLIQNAQARLE